MSKKKVKKPKVAKKTRVLKTRNGGTWSEAKYFGVLRNNLRRTFRYWIPMQTALKLASRPYNGPNKLQKKEYLCAKCGKWFKRTEVQIDHIQEMGELRKYEDIIPFIKKLTAEDVSAYQILCVPDHLEKSLAARDKRKAIRNLNP